MIVLYISTNKNGEHSQKIQKVTDTDVCHFYFIFMVVMILTREKTKVPACPGR